MANTIKGLVVEIGGDTSGLQKALNKVNSATSSLSKELRAVNSLLKLDPKNTDLLSQKQEILNENINETEKQLKLLHSTYQRYQETEANGQTISEEKWRALEREIIKYENQLKQLQLQASKWTQAGKELEEYGKKLEGIGNKIESLGNKLSTRVTLPIIAGFTEMTREAIEFESAFTGVTKTVDGSEKELKELKQGIKKLATEIPSTTTEISAVAEAAGQLGIKTEDILSFTKVMIDLGNSTNLSSEEAASSLAKFANITNMSAKDYDKLGATIVELGNNFATTEADIVSMATRLAATGELTGLSQSQILSLATAMSSVGIEAEAGGSAMSKLLKRIQVAVELGGEDLKSFSKVAGMTTKEFKKAFEKDAVSALSSFISGLNDTKRNGKSAIAILDDMGIKEVRLSNTILSLANASNVLDESVKLGNKAWKENTALVNEANKRYSTTESQLKIAQNKIKDISMSLGDKFLPIVNQLIDKVGEFTNKVSNLSDEEAENIIKIGLMVAAAGPLIKILGSVTSGIGTTVKAIGTFSQAVGVLKTGAESSSASVNALAKGIEALRSPAGLAAAGITIAVAGIIAAIQLAEKETKNSLSNIGNAATDFIKGIDTATSHLDSFNSTLFASAEEQQELENQMNEIQDAITRICKTASDERRDYTQEEVKQLEEYFNKLRELKNRELEIQQSIASAITQQAEQQAQSFQGSLEEYQILSQEWIKTAQEQAESEIKIIEDRTTQEIALLQQRYGDKATLDNEEYAREYKNVMDTKEMQIQQANDQVAKVNQAYSEGYLERTEQEDGFYKTLKKYQKEQETLTEGHNKKLEQLNNDELWYVTNKAQAIKGENETFAFHQKETWEKMYKDMDESQEEQLGTWLAMVAETELYGGKIDDETQEIVNSILDSYDTMPKGTKKAMKNAMEPMLTEMENKEPSLFSKASGIANGILSRLKKSFDIHSPSKETKKIFQNVMLGAEEGLVEEEKSLYNKVGKISNNTLKKLSGVNLNDGIGNIGNIGKSIIDQTKTVFTTPQIVFNVQELDEARLRQCFNYINNKFGSQY